MSDRYQVFKAANSRTMDKISICKLAVNVPHLVLKISEQNHPEHGRNIKVIMRDSKKMQMFSYLPPRFVKKLTSDHVNGFAQDILQRRPPFILFGGMQGKAFDISLLPFSLDIAAAALKGEPIEPPPAAIETEEIVDDDDLGWLDAAVANTSK